MYLTVRELMVMLANAQEWDDPIYVDTATENCPMRVEAVEENEYNWGFVIGKVDAV